MSDQEIITLSRRDYENLLERVRDLEDVVAAQAAENEPRIPHEVATAIMRGANPVRAWRSHRGLSLRKLAEDSGVSRSYLSEIECGAKPGSAEALRRLAQQLETSVECLLTEKDS